jgi:DNA-binding HxlR family transcriptional regulator
VRDLLKRALPTVKRLRRLLGTEGPSAVGKGGHIDPWYDRRMEASNDGAVKTQKSAYLGITPDVAAEGITSALRAISGRWKMTILFHLFGRHQRRFSELERLIPNVTQKMLTQHLRELERDGVLRRHVFPEVPPRVEYSLTELGEALCPALDELLFWEQTRVSARSDGARP